MATIILEHSRLTGSGRLGTVLRDYGHSCRVLRLDQGDAVPTDLDGVDAVIACGGGPSPIDDSIEWMEPEMNFLRLAHAAALPVIGICLGSQLLARALGGTVEPMAGGVSCAWAEMTLSPAGREDPLYAGMAWRSMQVVWHSCHVTKLPDGARTLASSELSPVLAWASGLRTYGIQYHPEVDSETIEAWADDEPSDLETVAVSREQLRRQTEEHYPAFVRLSTRFCEAVALLLMPLDRRYAGIAKDLHH